jgi:hypothetical protein
MREDERKSGGDTVETREKVVGDEEEGIGEEGGRQGAWVLAM